MNRALHTAALFSVASFLQACSPAPVHTAATEMSAAAEPATGSSVSASASAPAAATTATPVTTFNTSNTVRDIMNLMIEANARQLWNAVSYVVTADGAEETLPQSAEDWQRLRASAVALIEAGNALMVPGRLIDSPENVGDYEEFMFTPAEIGQLISTDPESWAYNLQEMQAATLLTLDAINARDLLRFTEQAATINQACESCHAQYWYRPLPMPR